MSTTEMCEVCGQRPKYTDGKTTHPYCGRTCANRAPKCLGPRCLQKGQTKFGGFCSPSHQASAPLCKQCRTTRAETEGFCSLCYRKYEETAIHKYTRLSEVQRGTPDFLQVEKTLHEQWTRGGLRIRPPQVCRVFKVQVSTEAVDSRIAYARSLSTDSNCKPTSYPAFYSNQCICDLGADNKPLTLCAYKSCGICKPLISCFGKLVFDEPDHSGRFGKGLYVDLDPKLADVHAISTTGSPYRIMLLSSVLLPYAPTANSQRDDRRDYEFNLDTGSICLRNKLSITPNFLIAYKK